MRSSFFYEEEPMWVGFKDKNGVDVFELDKVKFRGKEYIVKYFPNYGMFGLSDGSDKPLGHGGSSTKYKPYVLSEWYQKRMEVVRDEK